MKSDSPCRVDDPVILIIDVNYKLEEAVLFHLLSLWCSSCQVCHECRRPRCESLPADHAYDFTQHVISCFYMFIDPRSMQEMTLLTTSLASKYLINISIAD